MTVANEIVRTIELKAPISRVWAAVTDAAEFGTWFQCVVENKFTLDQISSCYSEHDGTKVHWQILVTALQPESYFAYDWSPGETGADLYDESVGRTKVEFQLEPTADGTKLTITESGFANLPQDLGSQSFQRNSQGWDAQAINIRSYLADLSE